MDLCERLSEVAQQLAATGAEAAEGRVRKIVYGCDARIFLCVDCQKILCVPMHGMVGMFSHPTLIAASALTYVF